MLEQVEPSSEHYMKCIAGSQANTPTLHKPWPLIVRCCRIWQRYIITPASALLATCPRLVQAFMVGRWTVETLALVLPWVFPCFNTVRGRPAWSYSTAVFVTILSNVENSEPHERTGRGGGWTRVTYYYTNQFDSDSVSLYREKALITDWEILIVDTRLDNFLIALGKPF